ncbi:MAG TPA: hypothetical protein VNI83_04870 [Vicinamibacterales bacterium]|nr:hypothetical protein [Vicinamibacterales bacterium]
MKSAPEGRRDRLIPLLAQAILEVRAAASTRPSAAPLAVVAAPYIPERTVQAIRRFAGEYASGTAVGVVDLEGLRVFMGRGLEALNATRHSKPKRVARVAGVRPTGLFSDLNQWMLKVLLAPRIPEGLLAAPRAEYRNASELAKAAGTSVMSAFRLLQSLGAEGFLYPTQGPIRLARLPELMRRWRAATTRPARDWPMRWVLRRDPSTQLRHALHRYTRLTARSTDRTRRDGPHGRPRVCLGLFAAADSLGVGFVRGVPPHIYVEELTTDVLDELGLSPFPAGDRADVLVRVPTSRESVFRGAVVRDGVPVADVLQVWLDVADHPARGEAQAREIERRVLGALLRGS